ncbi:MAG: transaldolase [Bdellovibrionales bacterium]|nr:transaldolase [Bdellovibrionales bacterium]
MTKNKGIQLFLDGADRAAMTSFAKDPKIHGFTTNPSLMRKSGVKDYRSFCRELLPELDGKPVSYEVFADDLAGMLSQAKEIASWAGPKDKLYVKIPVINTQGESTAPIIRELSQAKVRLNVTAVFTLAQSWEVCQALKGGAPSILSVFAGRIADTGRDPMPIMEASLAMCRESDRNIELLWASTREAFNIVQAEKMGCDIITAPGDLLKKSFAFGKDLFEMSLDTVKTFKADSEAAGFKL